MRSQVPIPPSHVTPPELSQIEESDLIPEAAAEEREPEPERAEQA